MTTWRESGIVPPSDGEESDSELSTQQDDPPPPPPPYDEPYVAEPVPYPNRGAEDTVVHGAGGAAAPGGLDGELAVGGGTTVNRVTDHSQPARKLSVELEGYQGGENGGIEATVPEGDHMEVSRSTSAVKPTPEAAKAQNPALSIANIGVLDLTNKLDESDDDESGAVGPEGMDVDAGHEDEDQDVPTPKPLNGRLFSSPDPITGEAQPYVAPSNVPRSPRQDPDASSITSSPLSSVPSSPTTPLSSTRPPPAARPRLLGVQVVIPHHQEIAASSSPIPLGPLALSSPAPQLSNSHLPIAPRSLRQRKPIQEHPYLIEQERYRRECQARGVRPVRIQETEEEAKRRRAAEADSQDAEYQAPQERDDTHLRRRGLGAPATPLAEPDPNDAHSGHRRRASGTVSDGVKRRKTEHAYSKKGIPGLHKSLVAARPGTTSKGNASKDVVTPRMVEGEATIYDFRDSSPTAPGSPSRGRASNRLISPTQKGSIDPRPTKMTDKELMARLGVVPPSPDSSPVNSQLSVRPSSVIAAPESSPPVTQRPRRRSPSTTPVPSVSRPTLIPLSSSSSSDTSATTTSSEEESLDIRKLQRKTNGVLPASWWKLDQQKRTDAEKRKLDARRRSLTPGTTNQPGVARARITTKPRTPVQDLFPDDSESSDEPTSTNSRPARSARSSVGLTSLIDLSREGEAEEDDSIDPMLPPIERKRRAGGTRRKRQGGGESRLEPTAPRNRGAGNSAPRAQRYTQTGLSDGRPKAKRQTKRVSSGPRLGITDAAQHYRETTLAPLPQFIRVAARKARGRQDRGRQSPARKLLVLDTAQDTQDVQGVLRDWREGTLPFGRHGVPEQQAYSDTAGPRIPTEDMGESNDQGRLPSPQPLGEGNTYRPWNRGHTTARFVRTISGKLRQTNLRDAFQPIEPPNRPGPRRRTIKKKPFAVVPAMQGVLTHRPAFALRSAQFEISVPGDYRAMRPYGHGMRKGTPDILALLQQRPRNQPLQSSNLRRFSLEDELGLAAPRKAQPQERNHLTAPVAPPLRRLRRKKTPQRIDVEVFERRQPPPQDIMHADEVLLPVDSPTEMERPILSGLLPYGAKYSLNFDTAPLGDGTIFNSETFIGKGLLTRALTTPPARVSMADRRASLTFAGKTYRWGLYIDSVATEFEEVMDKIGELAEKGLQDATTGNSSTEDISWAAKREAYGFYQSLVSYIADTLNFPDSVDFFSFGQRVLQAVECCCDKLQVCFGEQKVDPQHPKVRFALQANTFSLVFAFQVSRLASDDSARDRLALRSSFARIGHQLVSRLLRCGLDGIRSCYEDQRQRSKFERGIGSDHWLVEAWVVSMQILDKVDRTSFWQILNHELRYDSLERLSDIGSFERLWRSTFTLLPLYQFDSLGVARKISLEHPTPENWALLKALVGRPLTVYNSNQDSHGSSINDYCRVLYARCCHMVTKWRWANPDTIVPTLYEFFAKNGLENLKKEVDHGSPDFLHNLDTNPSLEVQDHDRCFHVFLKMIVLGVILIKETMPADKVHKKVGSLVVRLMPNHRRQYPKDKELQVDHLTALRNHHDLLETLYWVAPLVNRTSLLHGLRLLVDPKSSHRQALNVAVRSWSDLVRFQLHSGENIEQLKPFAEWFDSLAITTLAEHNAARSEAEQQFRTAKADGDTELSEDFLEVNIRRNQRQLEGILNDLVKSLSVALAGVVGQVQNAIVLLTKASTASILNSYNRLSHKLVIEVLDLLQQFLKTCQSGPMIISLPQESEDSQDYGDWAAFDELVVQNEGKYAAEHLVATTYDSLHQMLSNCFGADKQPEDALLVKTVDTWSLVAGFLVQHNVKNWDVYLEHGIESWSFFRATEQKRKFTAYFMTKLMQAGGDDVYNANSVTFLSYWMRTLVEREAMLRFQNEFTATLLNRDSRNPILSNLPFIRNEAGLFAISQTDFRLRRLSIISTVLTNMREHYHTTVQRSSAEGAVLKHQYAQILQAMMQSMKENYQELQAMAMSGEYVNFVHQIIEYLQQYSVELVGVDRFFTDSNSFPLPAGDPTYVIGKLKNYGLKLEFSRSHHQLISFVQAVSERAAWDGQQDYLINQFATALSGDFEAGEPRKPTLRAFFLHAVIPTYIERTFATQAGWILATPMLQALDITLYRLVTDVDSTLYNCVQSVISMLSSTFDAMRRAIAHLMEQSNPQGLHLASNLGILTLFQRCLAHALPLLDWLAECADVPGTDIAVECGCFLVRFAAYAARVYSLHPLPPLHDEPEQPLDMLAGSLRPQAAVAPFLEPARAAAKKALVAQECTWTRSDGSAGGDMGGDDRDWVHLGPGGNRRVVAMLPTLPREDEFAAAVEEVLCVAARTTLFSEVIKDVHRPLWELESRGWPWAARVRGRKNPGTVVDSIAEVFC